MAFFQFHEKERYISPKLIEDIPVIIENMYSKNKRLCLGFCVGYFTGARISEISSLKWDDIDLRKRTISFRRRAWNLPGTNGSRKKRTPKMRIVPLPLALGKLLCGMFVVEAGWLFPNEETGKHICRETLSRELKNWCDSCWNYSFTFHDLRHIYASQKASEEGNPIMVAKLLGHTDLKSTMIYTHFDLEEDNFVRKPGEKESSKKKAGKWKPQKWESKKRDTRAGN